MATEQASTVTTDSRPPKNVTSSSNNNSSDDRLPVLSLHDCLALGDVEVGLSLPSTDQNDTTNGSMEQQRPSEEEVQRLPLLLRILSSSRPLSSIPTMPSSSNSDDNLKDHDDNEKHDEDSDSVIQRAVDRLEARAAMYSAAEGVEGVVSHLAPTVCRKMSRLAPLQRTVITRYQDRWKQKLTVTVYDTDELEVVAKNPYSSALSRKKRRKGVSTTNSEADPTSEGDIRVDVDNDEESDWSENDEDDGVETPGETTITEDRKRKRLSTRDSLLLAAEDSQEATAAKTLSELANLVVQSLKSTRTAPVDEDHAQDAPPSSQAREGTDAEPASASSPEDTSWLSIGVDDSILAEPKLGSSSNVARVGGGMVSSDLASTVSSLMHHVPVLRHRHIASALCRAAVPQAALLIGHMGANCPAAVPCLVRGCVDVFELAQGVQQSIAVTAKKSILALANLSERERSRVRTIVRESHCMDGVLLEIALVGQDCSLEIACLVIEKLLQSTSSRWNTVPKEMRCRDETAIELSFRELIGLKANLACLVLHRLTEDLAIQRKRSDFNSVLIGRACIDLRAIGWMFLRSRIDLRESNGFHKVMMLCVEELRAWVGIVRGNVTDDDDRVECTLDRLFVLLLATISGALTLTFESQPDPTSISVSCCSILTELMGCISFSHQTSALLGKFISAVHRHELVRMISEILLQDSSCPSDNIPDNGHVDTSAICEWLLSTWSADLDALSRVGTRKESFVANPSVGLDIIRSGGSGFSGFPEIVTTLLKFVLEDASRSLVLIGDRYVPTFIEEAVLLLCSEETPLVPMILPIQLERLSVEASTFWNGPISAKGAQFLMNLFYSFLFMHHSASAKSPLVFDPRQLPIAEVYCICDTCPTATMSHTFRFKLIEFIDHSCPEVSARAAARMITKPWFPWRPSGLAPKEMINYKESFQMLIKKSVDEPTFDPSGILAERGFIAAIGVLSEAVLFTATVGALLSERNLPPRCYTYSGLYRDPLALLKCPISLWKRPGLRRITSYILSALLSTNDSVSKECTSDEGSYHEFIGSRNELILRCLTPNLGSSYTGTPPDCSVSAFMIRKIVAKDRGVLALTIKQGMSEPALDWLIEFVPECMDDSPALMLILTEKSSLTTAERLVVADAVLRIALAYGFRSPEEAKALVFASLSQLISSFFLVMGPVGVPVNTLIGDGSGLDATHLSRKAAFRMLTALLKVQSYREGVRSECVMALQKFQNLCKGESIVNSISGSLTGRQKNLVKELKEAISRAANAMGVGISAG